MPKILALRQAAETIGTERLVDCDLYGDAGSRYDVPGMRFVRADQDGCFTAQPDPREGRGQVRPCGSLTSQTCHTFQEEGVVRGRRESGAADTSAGEFFKVRRFSLISSTLPLAGEEVDARSAAVGQSLSLAQRLWEETPPPQPSPKAGEGERIFAAAKRDTHPAGRNSLSAFRARGGVFFLGQEMAGIDRHAPRSWSHRSSRCFRAASAAALAMPHRPTTPALGIVMSFRRRDRPFASRSPG